MLAQARTGRSEQAHDRPLMTWLSRGTAAKAVFQAGRHGRLLAGCLRTFMDSYCAQRQMPRCRALRLAKPRQLFEKLSSTAHHLSRFSRPEAPIPGNALPFRTSPLLSNMKLAGLSEELAPVLAEVLGRSMLWVGGPNRLERGVKASHLPWRSVLLLPAQQHDGSAVRPVDRTVRQDAMKKLV